MDFELSDEHKLFRDTVRDFVNGEIRLSQLPDLFEHMKNRNGQLKVAVLP